MTDYAYATHRSNNGNPACQFPSNNWTSTKPEFPTTSKRSLKHPEPPRQGEMLQHYQVRILVPEFSPSPKILERSPFNYPERVTAVNSPIHALTIGQQDGTHHGLNEEPLSFPFSPLVLYLALSGATPIMDHSRLSAPPFPLSSPILYVLESYDEYK